MATKNDKLVLNTIFNPFEPNIDLEDDEQISDAQCTITAHQTETEKNDLNKLKQMELEAVKMAEEGKLDESLKIFNQIIENESNYASGYNNRAQVHQMKGNVERALLDLKKAIELVDIEGCNCADKRKVLAQALTQRALIFRFQNDETRSYSDFQRAASLGNEFAKQQVVKLNPYAALCNSMLNQMFAKLRNGETDTI